MKREIKIINKDGLDKDTKDILSKKCYHVGNYIENDTLFVEVRNIEGGLVRIFSERIEYV